MKISLKVKAIVFILLFTLVLSISTVLVSYHTYTDAFSEHYRDLASSVSKSTSSSVNSEEVTAVKEEVLRVYRSIVEREGKVPDFDNYTDEDWENYHKEFEHITRMPEYNNILSLLTKLRKNNHVLSLYIGYSDLETMRDLYLVDASAAGEACYPGDSDAMLDEHVTKMEHGDYEFPAFITNIEEYGWLCSASAPIYDNENNVIGVALVDISMNKIMNDGKKFLSILITIIMAIAILMVLLTFFFVNRSVLSPIDKLSSATSKFVSSKKDQEHAEESDIAKLDIKTGDEIESLSVTIKKMEQDLNNYIDELTHITAEKERIGAELNVAQHIQSSMLPCIFPAFPSRDEFDVYATMDPAKEVGGDFYDFFMIDERHLAIVMADVSGKGVPAALFMVIAKTLIKDHSQPGADLGDVFTKVNELLCESNSEGLFVTAFEGVLDLLTGEFRFVNAGHEMPYICSKGGKYELYKVRPGFVLAGMENMKYKSGMITLREGDKIFQYTDGVTEATDGDNNLYGQERLTEILGKHSDKDPMALLPEVKADIEKFVGDVPQFDDITMLCLEYKKKMEGVQ